MNILIIGGTGYLGSKITRELVNLGHEVVCTKRDNSSIERNKDVLEKINWIPASIEGIKLACQLWEFQCVINLACAYGNKLDQYEDILNANIIFPLQVLNIISNCGIKKFITIDTGLPDNVNMYSFSKKSFGKFGEFFSEHHNMTFICLKLEMFYGADEPISRFIPSLIRKMIDGELVETTIGTQRRDIICVDDVIKAILIVFNSELKGFNSISVGTGIAPTISEIVDYVWEITGRKSKVLKGAIPLRPNEVDCTADNQMLESLGDWNPTYWKDGIRKMILDIEETCF